MNDVNSLASVCSRGYNQDMKKHDAYQKALDYIYSFVDYSRTHQQNLAPENFNLSRVRQLMSLLGNPEKQFPSIHVAGSKGKGSVCSFCSSALLAQGYKVGLYTSPHMVEFTERIRVNGEQIPEDELVDLLDEIKPFIESIPKITTFEIITALGFLYFARQKVDIAVIEVGLGGRLDATNVVVPEVSVITQLYLEHTFVLGNTLREIAGEKGGIIKQNVPVVISQQTKEAEERLLEIASERKAPVYQVGKDYTYSLDRYDLDTQSFWVVETARPNKKVHLKINLLGDFQLENAATAYAALDVLRKNGFDVSDDAIQNGFKQTEWEGRFEILQKDNPPVVLDSAHNKDAVIKLIQTVKKYFPNHKIVLIIGVSADKNIQGMLSEFGPYVRKVICTQSSHPRALDAEVLLGMAKDLSLPSIAISEVPDAFKKAISMARNDELVLVTGSIFVVAAARLWWREHKGLD